MPRGGGGGKLRNAIRDWSHENSHRQPHAARSGKNFNSWQARTSGTNGDTGTSNNGTETHD
jgi:hypothetical protein